MEHYTISPAQRATVIVLLIAEVAAVTVPVVILGKQFNFPDILRQPAKDALYLFHQHQPSVVLGYYIFLLSSLLYIPLSYNLVRIFSQTKQPPAANLFIGLGIVTAVFQAIGFIRWIFVMPYLAQTYIEQPASRQTVSMIYEMLNRYAGESIGEHLGFIAMGCWTIVLGVMVIQEKAFKNWLGYTGVLTGVLIIVSVTENFGGTYAHVFGAINFAANSIWSVWLVALAIQLATIRFFSLNAMSFQ